MTYIPDNFDPQCGIYMIKNTRNGKKYIGSTIDFKSRKNSHLQGLRKGSHHSIHLQRSWNKESDKSVFVFQMIIYCRPEQLLGIEQGCLDYMKPEYNRSPKVGRPLPFEFWTEEAKKQFCQKASERVSGDNNPSCRMTDDELTKRAEKGVVTRREKGTDVIGVAKGLETRKRNGTDKIIGEKALASRIANGTEKTRHVKMADTRHKNGSFKTGSIKSAETRKERGIGSELARKAAATQKKNGTQIFIGKNNPSLTLSKQELSNRTAKGNATRRWNAFQKLLEEFDYWGA